MEQAHLERRKYVKWYPEMLRARLGHVNNYVTEPPFYYVLFSFSFAIYYENYNLFYFHHVFPPPRIYPGPGLHLQTPPPPSIPFFSGMVAFYRINPYVK